MSTERTFLHDISSPLTSLQLNLESVTDMLGEQNPENIEICLKMLVSCLTQVKRAGQMVASRREHLMKEDNK